MKYAFENLEVWQKSRQLVKSVYLATEGFPKQEMFGLTSQLRRAAVSINSNIAEGSNRWSMKEKGRYYEISFGSLMEVLNQLILARDLEFITEEELQALRIDIDSVGRMLHGLYQSTRSSK